MVTTNFFLQSGHDAFLLVGRELSSRLQVFNFIHKLGNTYLSYFLFCGLFLDVFPCPTSRRLVIKSS